MQSEVILCGHRGGNDGARGNIGGGCVRLCSKQDPGDTG